jgi:putative flippase GtrA
MVDTLLRVWRLYHTPTGKKLLRYTMVSVISTGVSQFTLFIVFGVLQLLGGVWSNVIANAVATIPSYYLNRKWVWGKTGRSHLGREVAPFWALSFAGMALSTLSVAGAEHWGKQHFHHFGLTVLVLGANLAAFGVLWIGKFLIFNRMFHVHPVADLEAQAEAELVLESGTASQSPLVAVEPGDAAVSRGSSRTAEEFRSPAL